MRIVLALLLGGIAGVGIWKLCPCGSRANDAVRGSYVEARTASVFAGACHYNGELVTAGREALIGWHFDSGRVDGTSLAGIDAVAVVTADENLKTAGRRSSIVYLPEGLDADQREVALAVLREQSRGALGDVREVKTGAVSVKIADERYDVQVCGVAELSGTLMADRACCKMPQSVWYEPLAPIEGTVVGNSSVFSFRDGSANPTWKRSGENDTFVGSFEFEPSCAIRQAASACESRSAKKSCCPRESAEVEVVSP